MDTNPILNPRESAHSSAQVGSSHLRFAPLGIDVIHEADVRREGIKLDT
jgi:hypothetical protein